MMPVNLLSAAIVQLGWWVVGSEHRAQGVGWAAERADEELVDGWVV